MSDTFKATVIEVQFDVVQQLDSGKTFEGVILKYKLKDAAREKKFHKNGFKFIKNLLEQLQSLKPGDHIEITHEKKGEFTNFTNIERLDGSSGDTAPAKKAWSPAAGKAPYVDNTVGLQVGNALTNATTLIAHGHSSKSLEDTAIEILLLGNKLRDLVTSGKLDKGVVVKPVPTVEKKKAEAPKIIDSDDEIVWEDDDL